MTLAIPPSDVDAFLLERLASAFDGGQRAVVEQWQRYFALGHPFEAFVLAGTPDHPTGAAVVADPPGHDAPPHLHLVAHDDETLEQLLTRCAELPGAERVELWATKPLLVRIETFVATFGLIPGRRVEKLKLTGAVGVDALATEPFTPTDAATVAAINNAAFASHADRSAFTADTVLRELADHGGRDQDLRLVRIDDEVAAFAWTTYVDGVGEIYVFAVAPAFQGRGLAAPLLAAGVDHLQTSYGAETIVLYVDADNAKAIRLYERHGFMNSSEARQSFRFPSKR